MEFVFWGALIAGATMPIKQSGLRGTDLSKRATRVCDIKRHTEPSGPQLSASAAAASAVTAVLSHLISDQSRGRTPSSEFGQLPTNRAALKLTEKPTSRRRRRTSVTVLTLIVHRP